MAAIVWVVVVQNDLPTASEMMQQLINSHCTNGAAVSFAPDEVLPWAPSMCTAHVEIHRELLGYESTVDGQASPPFGAVDPGRTHLVRGGCWRTLWLLVCGRETVVTADFPRTFGLLRSTPATTAMVSILQPGCSIGSHQGARTRPFFANTSASRCHTGETVREEETLELRGCRSAALGPCSVFVLSSARRRWLVIRGRTK